MPYRRLPNTIASVIRTLVTARDEYKLTANPANRAITPEQFAKLNDAPPPAPPSLLTRFIKESADVDLAQAAQAPLTTNLAQSGARLTMFISHFHQVLDLGIARGSFAVGARSYYRRDIAASSIPDLSDYDAVAEAADNIVKGEAARATAEAAAYAPMTNPAAAEIGTLLGQFTTLRNQSKLALENTDTQREEMQALYPEAQALAVDICDQVEFFYRKDPDGGSFRTKCQRWGVVYIYDQQPATPTPVPTSTPTPPQL